MDRDTELDLVRRVRGADVEAFDLVHAEFNARLFSFLARLSRRRDVAEDLLEEVWLRFVTHAAKLTPDTRLGPWLFTVARNVYVSYCRSRAIEDSHASLTLWPSAAGSPSPFEQTAANELERRVETALSELPSDYREVLLLVFVEGMQPAEAAEVCGVTPQAMRQRLSRARARLARLLDDSRTVVRPVLRKVI